MHDELAGAKTAISTVSAQRRVGERHAANAFR
jgi:hypothetical protein